MIVEKFKKFVSAHPFAFGIGLSAYLLIVIGFPFYQIYVAEKAELRDRVVQLELKLNEQRLVSTRLATIERPTSLFKDLEFSENWLSNEAKVEVHRLLEYADFAIKKKDFSRALGFYKEAAQVQDTMTAHYYTGKTLYLSGDLDSTEKEWRKAISLDTEDEYPVMRLYLGVVLYEQGKIEEAKNFLSMYLRDSDKNSNQ